MAMPYHTVFFEGRKQSRREDVGNVQGGPAAGNPTPTSKPTGDLCVTVTKSTLEEKHIAKGAIFHVTYFININNPI